MVAYKRPKNIRDTLIRSKVPKAAQTRSKRKTAGMRKCNKCGVCSYIKEGKTVQATANSYKVDINSSVDCSSKNVIYMLGCNKCPQQYIGETERMLRDRFTEHKGYVNTNNISKTAGAHFNLNDSIQIRFKATLRTNQILQCSVSVSVDATAIA